MPFPAPPRPDVLRRSAARRPDPTRRAPGPRNKSFTEARTSIPEVGDRIRIDRRAAVRYGVIDDVGEDGTVIGEVDDDRRFIRDASMLADLVLAGDDPASSGSEGQGSRWPDPQPGDRVVVTWPGGRRFGVVHPGGSYVGRREVRSGAATVQVITPRS